DYYCRSADGNYNWVF
nr:immunoglobulin light chain junction region [Macaca mulatta]